MDLKRELFINGQQPVYGCSGTFTGDFFQSIIDECIERHGGVSSNPHFLLSQAFGYGVIQGKRAERARRRGEPFDIDRPNGKKDFQALIEIICAFREKSIDEVKETHALALKELQPRDKVAEFLHRLTTMIIEEKEGEGPADA